MADGQFLIFPKIVGKGRGKTKYKRYMYYIHTLIYHTYTYFYCKSHEKNVHLNRVPAHEIARSYSPSKSIQRATKRFGLSPIQCFQPQTFIINRTNNTALGLPRPVHSSHHVLGGLGSLGSNKDLNSFITIFIR